MPHKGVESMNGDEGRAPERPEDAAAIAGPRESPYPIEAPPVQEEAIEAPPVVAVEPPKVPLDAAGRLVDDVPCRQCGYNLRGLGLRDECPECGQAVWWSARGDLLKFSEPGWVARLGRGVGWIIGSLIAQIILAIGGIPVMVWLGAAIGAMHPLYGAVLGVVAVGVVYGVWLLTTPDPGSIESERPLSARRLARWCIILSVLSVPLQLYGNPTGGAPMGNPATAITLSDGLLIALANVLHIAVLVGWVALAYYARGLAGRIPRRSLGTQALIVAWGMASVSAVNMIAVLFMLGRMPALATGARDAVFAVFASAACFSSLAALVFGIWALVLMFLYRSALTRCAQEAARCG